MPRTFLTIPPEIRDVVIEIILLSSRLAPPNIAAAALTRQTVVPERDYETKPFLTWEFGRHNVKFEKPGVYTTPNALPLLLTNHQLNTETRSAIARLGDSVRCYELDIIIINKHELWPTWTRVPVLTRHVEQIDVTFRLYAKLENLDNASGFDTLNAPPGLIWCFYFVLEHFLSRGPGGTFGVWGTDKEICVKTLNVAFVAGEGQQILREGPSSQHLYGTVKLPNTRCIAPPRCVARFISNGLIDLLNMGCHTAKYGAILHERVGIIRVFVDREFWRQLDIAPVLAKLAFNDASDTFGHIRMENRLSSFWQWKRNTVQLRHERGLPVERNNVFEE